jgi:hypothetical protein
MSFKMYLEIVRDPKSILLPRGPDDDALHRVLTKSKSGASIAGLMLFDRTSLAEAANDGETYRVLFSDCRTALQRFGRRLPLVLDALGWHPLAVDTLPRFGMFFETIDWPCVLLETGEYRLNFLWELVPNITVDDFDRALQFAVDAIDDRPMRVSGNPFGGGGRYSPTWERLLEFCLVSPALIYAGSPVALEAWPWGYPPGANDSSEQLKANLRASPIASRAPYAGFLK